MRFMAIVKPGKDYEAGRPPSPGLMAAMGKLNEESTRAGIFVTGGGLLPSSQGYRLSMTGGKVTVTDGPFTETKEVIGGFAILNYATHDEAIAGARRVMQIHAEHGITELEIELRPMMDPPECGQVPQEEASAA
ncbi:MAG: hypothetical protein QOH67_1348 [Hyphomicrobiales bacterium]|jgi:hypothetical protein|nr:hypothetical protein [Hyphomicrobiales bacterium]